MPHRNTALHFKRATAPLTLLVLLALGGCAGPAVETSPAGARSQAPQLVGSEWRLQDLNGRALLDGVSATLAFPEVGRVSGSGSCNRFTGSVSTDTNLHMQLSQIASTRMSCPGAIAEQESRYLGALQQVHHFEVQGRQLLLYVQGENLPLRFERTRP
jgi:heat shock protein HslJ